MRNSVRLAGVAATAAAMLTLGSPAFAAEGGQSGHYGKGDGKGSSQTDSEGKSKTGSKGKSKTTADADGGRGGVAGDAGKGIAINVCPSISVMYSEGGNPQCSALDGGDANGGNATSEANDDTKKFEKGAAG